MNREPILTLRLPQKPMPCPRPRVALRGRIPVAYYPKDYQVWKEAVADSIREALVVGPTAAQVRVVMDILVTAPKTTKLLAPKPDVDNYAKAYLDAMTVALVWDDDCQVQELTVRKRWVDYDAAEEEGAVIHVYEYLE